MNGNAAARSGEWAQHFSNAFCFLSTASGCRGLYVYQFGLDSLRARTATDIVTIDKRSTVVELGHGDRQTNRQTKRERWTDRIIA